MQNEAKTMPDIFLNQQDHSLNYFEHEVVVDKIICYEFKKERKNLDTKKRKLIIKNHIIFFKKEL